jgi:hypothetical protein
MRVTADKYYGHEAETYDAQRRETTRWKIEQQAVEDFVSEGPVLDIPLGTGRYVPIYRRKGLEFFGVDLSRDMLSVAEQTNGTLPCAQGSILSQPCDDEVYATAVCTRLMDWLCPSDMIAAINELRRVARTLIVTIRHGEPRISINYTHGLDTFYEAIDGLFIEARRTTENGKHGHEEIFKLRSPCWQDVADQLAWHDGDSEAEIERLSGVAVCAETATVRAEYWTNEKIGATVHAMAAIDRRYRTRENPRFHEGPATILQADERSLIIDGRRRMNQWQKVPGRYPILVVTP